MSHDSQEPEGNILSQETGSFCPYCMSRVAPGETCPTCGLTQGAYTPSPHHLPPGTILSRRYLVGRVLGEGGFGITYIGCDLRLEMKVAIKEYFPADRASRYAPSSLSVVTRTGGVGRDYSAGLKKFLYEARTMARMEKQPQIVMVRDFFEANNTAYIVMEYVEGTNFMELVAQRGGRIPAQELLPLIEPLFSALSAVHEAGLIHRDISPDNLMLERGAVRLLDFGCARESSRGTETMTIALKQGYAPIEQYQHKGQGSWTDVYALSATIYYCLTGRVPPQALDRILEDELVPPRELGVDLTPGQERALLKGMEIQPRKRYQSVDELHTGLYYPEEPDPVISDLSKPTDLDLPEPTDLDLPEPEKRRMPEWLGVAAAVAALVIALLVILPAISSGDGTDDPDDPDDIVTSEGDESEDVDPAALVEDEDISVEETAEGTVATLKNTGSATALRALLESSDVSAVIVTDCNINLEGNEDILEINKPVYLNSSGLNSCQAIVVGEGGSIEVGENSIMGVNAGLLRLTGGGSVTVKDGGALYAWKIWIEQEDDLILEDGSELDLYGQSELSEADTQHYLVIQSEDALFADATPVSTWNELCEAMEDESTQAIRITSGSSIRAGWFSQTVPVLIEEGAVVTCQMKDESAWNVDGTYLVNYGTMEINLNLNAADEQEGSAVNYGTYSGDLSCDCLGNLINLGEMNLDGAAVKYCDFVNLGTVNLDGGGDIWFFDFRDNNILNYGKMTLEGESTVAYITSNYRFVNAGTLTIGANAQLCNYGTVENYGTISLTDGSAELLNEGYIRCEADDSRLTAVEGCNINSSGVIIYSNGGAVTLPEDTEGIALLNANSDGWADASQSTLKSVLADDSVEHVTVQGDECTISGDLTVNKPLLAGSLTVEGNLTVTGDGTFLYVMDITCGSLTVSDGAVVVCDSNCAFLDGVTVEGDARLYLSPYGQKEIGASLTLRNGARFNLIDGMSLDSVAISIEDYSSWHIMGELNLCDCSIYVEESCELRSDFTWINMNGGCSLTNYGEVTMNVNHWMYTFTLDGDMENYGTMDLDYDGEFCLYGNLNNYGDLYAKHLTVKDGGELDNRGTLYLDEEDGELSTEDSGVISGNDPVAYDRY